MPSEKKDKMPNTSTQSSQQKTGFLYLLVLKMSKYLNINTIVYLPVLLSAFVLLMGFLIGEQVYKEGDVPDGFIGTVFFAMSLIASLSGFIQIAIEEVPGLLLPIKGKVAVVFGSLWIAVFWSSGIYAIFYYFL